MLLWVFLLYIFFFFFFFRRPWNTIALSACCCYCTVVSGAFFFFFVFFFSYFQYWDFHAPRFVSSLSHTISFLFSSYHTSSYITHITYFHILLLLLHILSPSYASYHIQILIVIVIFSSHLPYFPPSVSLCHRACRFLLCLHIHYIHASLLRCYIYFPVSSLHFLLCFFHIHIHILREC